MKNYILIIKDHLKTPHFIIKNIMWRLRKSICREKIIFVLGTPRSGTTLLQYLLASHSKLYTIQSETAVFSYQNLWSPNRNLFDFDNTTKQQILNDSNDSVDFFSKSVIHLNSMNPGKTFVEKTPQHIIRLSFLIKHFPNSKFIHLVRDGRDCYCSAKKHPFIPQSRSLKTFTKFYNKCLEQAIKNDYNNNLYHIRYEDLVDNPNLIINELMSFLDLKIEDNQISNTFRYKDKRATLEHFKKLNNPINNSSVGKWKKELKESENEIFIKYSKTSLEYFNYPIH